MQNATMVLKTLSAQMFTDITFCSATGKNKTKQNKTKNEEKNK